MARLVGIVIISAWIYVVKGIFRDNIFFRVTGKERLHQEYSFVVMEEDRLRSMWRDQYRKRIDEEIKGGHIGKDELAELDRALADGEINRVDYLFKYEELIDKMGNQHRKKYSAETLEGVKNKAGDPMKLQEVVINDKKRLAYPGPNTVEKLKDAMDIASRRSVKSWKWVDRQDIKDPVIHVIRGRATGKTWDGDGIVITPEETIAVFDWNQKFEDGVHELLGTSIYD